MKILIIGSMGQLGSACVEIFRSAGHHVIPSSHAEVEVADRQSVRRVLERARPDAAINCAAYVRVNDAEDHAEDALRVNAIGARHVALACAEFNTLCVYVSTDYVFDGALSRPYTEQDACRPLNVYGTSKLAGEYLVQQCSPRWLIARVASLFGKAGSRSKGGNFVDTIVRNARAGRPIRVVNDVRMSPTYALDAARAMEHLVSRGATGLFHLANAGNCTWLEFARRILATAGSDTIPEGISSLEYPTKAPRPRNSSLRSSKLSSEVRAVLRPWEDAVAAYFLEKNHEP
ncbi:MAG: dTDP-4-dehydrorhamnose reductase [Nitrospirae bacterium]|nr:MAG: dTDP-4-dehydrorhamnose reductase [Nitrospirota bacterium]